MSKDNFRMSGSIQPTPHYCIPTYSVYHATPTRGGGGQNYLLTYLKQANQVLT